MGEAKRRGSQQQRELEGKEKRAKKLQQRLDEYNARLKATSPTERVKYQQLLALLLGSVAISDSSSYLDKSEISKIRFWKNNL